MVIDINIQYYKKMCINSAKVWVETKENRSIEKIIRYNI